VGALLQLNTLRLGHGGTRLGSGGGGGVVVLQPVRGAVAAGLAVAVEMEAQENEGDEEEDTVRFRLASSDACFSKGKKTKSFFWVGRRERNERRARERMGVQFKTAQPGRGS
jgi:hypothetical protein